VSAYDRYRAAAHAIQTGVALALDRGDTMASPKQLRVGIDLRACDHAALVRLLIAKGVVTEEEYLEAIADEAEREKKRIEDSLLERYGVRIGLA
jgi:hypothetical protein